MIDGLITAIVTPMDIQGNIDYTGFSNLLRYQLNNNVDGFVVLGSTGEAATLKLHEKMELINAAILSKKKIKNCTVIVGVSQNSTDEAVLWVQELNKIEGIDSILALTPAYVKPTQNGLYAHFAKIAEASLKPIILYNVPGRTGCDLLDVTALKLANAFPNIVGLKDSTGNLARLGYLVKNKPANFKLYSGDDATTLAFVLSGGNGAISVTGNVAPKTMTKMVHAALLGHKDEAIKLNNLLLDLHTNLFVESNPIPVKWALNQLGVINSHALRLPLQELNHNYHEIVKAALLAAKI